MSVLAVSAKKRRSRGAVSDSVRKKGNAATTRSTILVALRVRPFIENEDQTSALRVTANQVAVLNGEDEILFGFSNVFGTSSDLDMLYKDCIRPLVSQAVDGYNVCVMAYGQTGSGKTYCMSGNDHEEGVIYRFCMDLFDMTSKQKGFDQKFTVSFYEIYQEKAYDLLCEDHVSLRVRGGANAYLQDLSVCEISSFEDLEALRRIAWTRRSTAATAMNICSSRSHTFMQLTYSYIEAELKELGDNVNRVSSNIYFVDLAGSERLSKVGYMHFDQMVSINSSLSALHRVIFFPGSKLKPSYRDSLLTRLLKDCLGGNARTVLIANVTPSLAQRQETLSTLRFASQAATVRQCAVKNSDPVVSVLLDLKQQNRALKTRVEELESLQKIASFDCITAPSIVEFQPDPSLTMWQALVRELRVFAFDSDLPLVVFTLEGEVINIIACEEGVFVNGEYLHPNILSRVNHGDRVVVNGERIFFVYADPNGLEELMKCSYYSVKVEHLEKVMERYHAEVLKMERNRRRSEADTVVKSLVDQIETLKAALADKENQQITSVEKEHEALQIELKNCLDLKQAFLDICKGKLFAFDKNLDSFVEKFKFYSKKKNVEMANLILSSFGKENEYSFQLVSPEMEEAIFGVRIIDERKKMYGDLEMTDFGWVFRRLEEYYQDSLLGKDRSANVNKLMFTFCTEKIHMSRLDETNSSNSEMITLSNSRSGIAKRRRTTFNELRLSLGISNFGVVNNVSPENEIAFKSQFIRHLLQISTYKDVEQWSNFVESLCNIIVELKKQLYNIQLIQEGKIKEEIELYSVLCRTVAVVNKVDGFVQGGLGFKHSASIECSLKSVAFAWQCFNDFFSSWLSLFGDAESEEVLEEDGIFYLEHMFEALRNVVTTLGRLAPFTGGKLSRETKFQEISNDFISGSRQAVSEIKEKAEEVTLRFRGKPNLLYKIAVIAAETLIQTCEEVSTGKQDDKIFTVISPLFAAVQLIVSKVVDPVYFSIMEKECARKILHHLKPVAEVATVSNDIREAIGLCERAIETQAVGQASIATVFTKF